MDIDSMLEKAGDFGRYQVFLMFLFSIVNIVSAFHYFSQTFISVVPEHWCNTSQVQDLFLSGLGSDGSIDEYTANGIRNLLSPLPNPSCTRFSDQGDEFYANGFNKDGEVASWTAVKCDSGWIYNRDNGFESIVTELNWVCDDDWKPVLGQSTFFVGSVIGTLILGFLSDRIGRLPVLCIANFFAFIGNLSTIFAKDLVSFSGCRFLSGLATDSNFVMMYIIVMEYVRPSMRTFGLNLCIGVFYCLGCVAVPLVAISMPNWRHFLLVTSIPIGFITLYYFLSSLVFLILAVASMEFVSGQQYYKSNLQVQPQSYKMYEQYEDAHPKYQFEYKVEDSHTGDYHSQQESRDGDKVEGYYTLVDADGYLRTVQYSSSKETGFLAKVIREPAPQYKQAAPQYQQAVPQYKQVVVPQYKQVVVPQQQYQQIQAAPIAAVKYPVSYH